MATTLKSMFEKVFGDEIEIASTEIMRDLLVNHYTKQAEAIHDALYKDKLQRQIDDLVENFDYVSWEIEKTNGDIFELEVTIDNYVDEEEEYQSLKSKWSELKEELKQLEMESENITRKIEKKKQQQNNPPKPSNLVVPELSIINGLDNE